MLTKDEERRVIEAIADCDRYIAKESPRNPDTRPTEAAQHLEFCIAHKAKLIGMLAQS